MYREGGDLESIPKSRGLAPTTIAGHLCTAVEAGERLDWSRFFSATELADLRRSFEKSPEAVLTPIHESFGGRFTFEQLRLFRALWTAGQAGPQPSQPRAV